MAEKIEAKLTDGGVECLYWQGAARMQFTVPATAAAKLANAILACTSSSKTAGKPTKTKAPAKK